MKPILVLFVFITAILSSCTINSHVMLKTPKDYVFDTPPEKPVNQYILSPNDIIQFRLFSNNGFQIVDVSSTGNTGASSNFIQRSLFNYLIQEDSTARLPIVGNIKLAGNTVREAELFLQDTYSKFYVDPYVQVQITNKRIIIFPGTGSNAQVIGLANNNTTLIEALALAGGIAKESKASKIKIIRKVEDKYEIYLVDLSTINGLQQGKMIVQGNDVIYVQPNANLAREALSDISPIVSLLSSSLFVWATLRTLSK